MMRRLLLLAAVVLLAVPAVGCEGNPYTLTPVDGGATYYGRWSNSFPTDPSFFPVAVFNSDGIDGSPAKYKQLGITVVFNFYHGLTPAMETQSAAAGMYVVDGPDATSPLVKAVIPGDEPDGDGTVYCTGDPNNPNDGVVSWLQPLCVVGADGRVTAASVNVMADEIRRRDPSRPVVVQVTKPVAIGEGLYDPNRAPYLAGSDICSFDYYPLTDPYEASFNPQVWNQYNAVQEMRRLAGNAKPIGAFIELSRLFANGVRVPSPAQIRAETWQALIAGARWISWFKNDFSPGGTNDVLLDQRYVQVQDTVKALGAEMHAMAPWLNGPYVSGAATVAAGQVNYSVRTDDARTHINLFAATKQAAAQDVTFDVHSLPDGTQVQVLGEVRSLTVAGGRITDSFTGETGVHTYQLA